jgi:ATP-dependent Lon protease
MTKTNDYIIALRQINNWSTKSEINRRTLLETLNRKKIPLKHEGVRVFVKNNKEDSILFRVLSCDVNDYRLEEKFYFSLASRGENFCTPEDVDILEVEHPGAEKDLSEEAKPAYLALHKWEAKKYLSEALDKTLSYNSSVRKEELEYLIEALDYTSLIFRMVVILNRQGVIDLDLVENYTVSIFDPHTGVTAPKLTAHRIYSMLQVEISRNNSQVINSNKQLEKTIDSAQRTDQKTESIKVQNPDKVPENTLKQIQEVYRLAKESSSSYAARYKQVIGSIEKIPFGVISEDKDILEVEKSLEEEVYGMQAVKDKILQILAYRQIITQKTPIKPILLVGKPGVGKTHFAQVLGKALGRTFFDCSASDLNDGIILKGDSAQWIGSNYGNITKAMILGGSMNPVFLIDELDKINLNNASKKTNVLSLLLEILDPRQNPFFQDNFLGIELDISQFFFILTANELYPIPEALKSRLTIIEIPSYSKEDKMNILNSFLIPKYLNPINKTKKYRVTINEEAKSYLVQSSQEDGVRELEGYVKDICEILSFDLLHGSFKNRKNLNIDLSLTQKYLSHIKEINKKGIGF